MKLLIIIITNIQWGPRFINSIEVEKFMGEGLQVYIIIIMWFIKHFFIIYITLYKKKNL